MIGSRFRLRFPVFHELRLICINQVIEAEQESGKQWELTEEGKEVVEHGSHEARVFHAIPPHLRA
ncbi:unnamed protein product [Darwinula stevensoni]|uniref:Uncharacterized protein n=1 Tax=Darwinula stevensoni TaxID=69355 RepID=A0A7R9A9X1_9CRUS|nr:unnamed protein product [Darwinula stevensoni]CAG0897617.1 unnamed protein product [Darwinula stevensoni]